MPLGLSLCVQDREGSSPCHPAPGAPGAEFAKMGVLCWLREALLVAGCSTGWGGAQESREGTSGAAGL